MPTVAALVASAGGVDALKQVVGALPDPIPGTVLVSLHLSRDAGSLLAGILDRKTSLVVREAQDGEPLPVGQIRVARPDAHLLVVDGRVVLGRGARENGHRPSHDALLRSLAVSCGRSAVGAVLTGLLDDGAAGLAAVQRYGGTCIVQDPEQAEFASMPLHAQAAVPAARAVRLEDLAQEVVRAMSDLTPRPVPDLGAEARSLDEAELRSALGHAPEGGVGTPSPYACPDCHGVLNEVPDANTLRFRCRTGHAWTADSLLSQQAVGVEEALWTALRTLEEREQIARALATTSAAEGRTWSAEHYQQRADDSARSAAALRPLLLREVSEDPRRAAGT